MKTLGAYIIGFCLLLTGMVVYTQNAPVTTIGSYVGNETSINIPITVTNFINIGSCNLKLTYDPAIASATEVTAGPLLNGQLSANLSEPGNIVLGWYTYPGLTLPDNTIIFNIEFSQVSSGNTDIIWEDDGLSCAWSDDTFNYLYDIPTSSYYINGSLNFQLDIAPHTLAPNITACSDSIVDIPVRVTSFSNIGAVSLTLHYDEWALSYQSYTNNSGFPGLIVNESNPGIITAAGFTASPDGFSLSDSSIFFTIHCINLGNSTQLNWYDDGESCEYAGSAPSYTVLEDTPQGLFYFDGSFTQLLTPEAAGTINGPFGGNVCQGETDVIFMIDPIVNAAYYEWTLTDGASITSGEYTNTITVSFDQNANSGNVTVYGTNACGSGTVSPLFPLTLNSPPIITEQPFSPDTIIAGNGIAYFTVEAAGSNLEYQWQEFVTDWNNINNGGVYSGANTSTLSITDPPLTMYGYNYRCIISGICEPSTITDGLATLTVILTTGIDKGNFKLDNTNNLLRFNAYPNPFNNELTFNFYLSDLSDVQINVYDLLGNEVFNKVQNNIKEGDHTLKFDRNKLQQGFYTARILVKTKNNLMSSSIKIICNN